MEKEAKSYATQVNQQAGWMTMWNSSKATNPQTAQAVADGSWDVPGSTFDGSRGIQWNVTIPKGLPGSVCHAEVNDCILGSQSSAFPSYSGYNNHIMGNKYKERQRRNTDFQQDLDSTIRHRRS